MINNRYMKKTLIILIMISGVFLYFLPANAHRSGCHRWHSCPSDSGSYACGDLGYPCRYSTYPESNSSYLNNYTSKTYQNVAGCSVWAETLDEVNNINKIYYGILGRDCRCDELEFHVEHKTPHDKLRNWLIEEFGTREVSVNLGSLEGKTIRDRSNGRLYLIKDGSLHWVPDVLTMASHGLIYEDGIMLEYNEVSSITLGYQLKYWEGKYFKTIKVVLEDGNREAIRFLPRRLNVEVEKLADPNLNWRGINQILGR